jgi:hypothetical protein
MMRVQIFVSLLLLTGNESEVSAIIAQENI